MPTVPTYNAPQEQMRALPGAQQTSVASPALFGEAARQQVELGQRMERAGGQMLAVATRMQEQENADMLFRAETTLKNEYLEFEKAARERRGDAAKDLAKDAASWWDKKAREHTEALGNDRQRQLFKQQVEKLRLQSLDSISSYEAGERRRSLNESAQASIVGSINLAASQVGTPTERAAVAGAKDDVLKRLAVQRQLNGWSPEMYEAKQAEALTNLHLQVIGRKVDSDPAGAKEYFNLNKGEINGTKHGDVEKVLKAGGLKALAQGAADELVGQGLSEADALKAVRAKYSGDEEAAAVAEVKVRFAEQTQARERSQRDAADTAWGIYTRAGRMSAIPADVLARLDGRDLAAIKRDAEAKAERAKAGPKLPDTNWDRYYELRQMAFDNPEQFAQADLRREFPHLGGGARESLIDLQTRARDAHELKDAATMGQQLAAMHNALGYGARDMERKGKFDLAVQAAINAEQKAKGKKLTYDERQAIMDRLVIEGEIDGSGILRDDRGRVFELQGREDFGDFAPKVPKVERDKIEAALKRAGRPVSDAAVLQLYKQKHGLQ